jgi:hypothetical protein
MHRSGQWLPQDRRIQQQWLSNVIQHVHLHPRELHPVLKEFKHLIEDDTTIYMLVQSMFAEVPRGHLYNKDPIGDFPRIRDYKVRQANPSSSFFFHKSWDAASNYSCDWMLWFHHRFCIFFANKKHILQHDTNKLSSICSKS